MLIQFSFKLVLRILTHGDPNVYKKGHYNPNKYFCITSRKGNYCFYNHAKQAYCKYT